MTDERIPAAYGRKFDVTLTFDRRDPLDEEIIAHLKRAKFGQKTARIKKLVQRGFKTMKDQREGRQDD